MSLEHITKKNFVAHPPFFKVYDYWYNILVDHLNNISTTVESLGTGITAFATGGQASATQLTEYYSNVTVCATAGDSVKLPTALVTAVCIVKNNGAASLNVFPGTDDAINGLAANLAVAVPVGAEVKFTAINATTWESDSETLVLSSPSTQKGQLIMRAANSAGETATVITNASQAGARTYTIPDAGASVPFCMNLNTDDNKSVTLHENLVIAEGYDVTITAEDVASSITLDEQTFEVEGEGTATRLTKIVNLADAAATLSISGVTCALDQNLRIAASPTFAAVYNTTNVGAVGTSVTAVEYGDGRNHTTVLTLTTKAYTIGDNASLGIGSTIYTLPAGCQVVNSAYISVGLTATDVANAANTPEVGLGSTTGTGATAVLTGTMEDIFEGDAIANCTGTAYVLAKTPTAAVPYITQTGGTKTIYLNFAAAWLDNAVQTATASGTVVLNWTTLA